VASAIADNLANAEAIVVIAEIVVTIRVCRAVIASHLRK